VEVELEVDLFLELILVALAVEVEIKLTLKVMEQLIKDMMEAVVQFLREIQDTLLLVVVVLEQ
tara:strand:+ start:451 stop:639 length:189 start_codon:yes stop_codon:yes gene_type:complete